MLLTSYNVQKGPTANTYPNDLLKKMLATLRLKNPDINQSLHIITENTEYRELC